MDWDLVRLLTSLRSDSHGDDLDIALYIRSVTLLSSVSAPWKFELRKLENAVKDSLLLIWKFLENEKGHGSYYKKILKIKCCI